jgi:Uma2 family endonuclease
MATASLHTQIGSADHGRRMSPAAFARADFEEGWLYELARGVDVTEVPGIPHARIVQRLNRLFVQYELSHPDVIDMQAGGGECRIRTPGFRSDRHPDRAIYLTPPPTTGSNVWGRWIPDLVVEVVSKGGENRDYVEKAEEYLRAGVREYWVVDPGQRRVLIHRRDGDTWTRKSVSAPSSFRTKLLPGLTVDVGALLGPEP